MNFYVTQFPSVILNLFLFFPSLLAEDEADCQAIVSNFRFSFSLSLKDVVYWERLGSQ